MQMLRKIIEIDEEKCDGCGQCVPSCEEGALAIIDGKARLVRDSLCDGLGNCLGECPRDAIRIVEREAERFELPQVHEAAGHHGCPGSRVMSFAPRSEAVPAPADNAHAPSTLRQWPVQLTLVPPFAPYLQGADLLIAADCVPFAYADFHSRLLSGRALLVGCPKLDDFEAGTKKLAAIFQMARPRSITIANMEVPCCFGIVHAARVALGMAGHAVPIRVVTIAVDGTVKSQETIEAA